MVGSQLGIWELDCTQQHLELEGDGGRARLGVVAVQRLHESRSRILVSVPVCLALGECGDEAVDRGRSPTACRASWALARR